MNNVNLSRPRILTERKKMQDVLERIKEKEKYKILLDRLEIKCDDILKNNPIPEYKITEDIADGWQRRLGDNMCDFTAAYCFGGKRKYYDAAIKWVTVSCGYPTWSREHYANCDIVAAHQLFGVAFAYDWLYDELTDDIKTLMRDTIIKKARCMYEATDMETTFWSKEWLQNHMWINMTGLLAAAIAVYDETDEADSWINKANEKLAHTMALLGSDGASHEGYTYWQYGGDWLIIYATLAAAHCGIDYFKTDWFKNTSMYGIYMLAPKNMWNSGDHFYPLGDSDRTNLGLYGTEYQSHFLKPLAARYGDGYAQLVADESNELFPKCTTFKDILFYDDTVQCGERNKLPTQHYFEDMGIVSLRSDWSGDESAVVFRCGPYIGHNAFDQYDEKKFVDWGGGHVHPDVNHFMIYGCGENFLTDDEYSHKQTSNHSTLMVNGVGQAGEGWVWFEAESCHDTGGKPYIATTDFNEAYDFVVCDGTYAYPKHSGLTRFVRYFLYLKPNTLVVIDDVKAKTVKCFELRFVPRSEVITEKNGKYFVKGKAATMCVENHGIDFSVEKRAFYSGRNTIACNTREYGYNKPMFLARTRDNGFVNATAFSWSRSENITDMPIVKTENRVVSIEYKNKVYVVDIDKYECNVI